MTMLPFFIYLNYRGWLRSDTYEEIVGLDISYHGGGMRLSIDDGVGIQFVEAHRRRRLEEEEKTDRHQCEAQSEETTKVLDAVDETLSDPDDLRGIRQHSEGCPSPASALDVQRTVVEIEEPSSHALTSGSDVLFYG